MSAETQRANSVSDSSSFGEQAADVGAGRLTEEGVGLVRVVQLERRDLAGDDLAKDAVGVGLGGHLEECTGGGEGENDGQRMQIKPWRSCEGLAS